MNIRPLGSKIIVLPDPIKETTIRGIIIPESVQSPLEEGAVILVSKDVQELLQPGEKILYPRNAGVEKEIDGVKYKIINGPTLKDQGDVWAIV
jgi:co-chaperonin GroES (HSP10)